MDSQEQVGRLLREIGDLRKHLQIAEDAHRRLEERMQALEQDCQDVRDTSRAVRMVKPLAWVVTTVIALVVVPLASWAALTLMRVEQAAAETKVEIRYIHARIDSAKDKAARRPE